MKAIVLFCAMLGFGCATSGTVAHNVFFTDENPPDAFVIHMFWADGLEGVCGYSINEEGDYDLYKCETLEPTEDTPKDAPEDYGL